MKKTFIICAISMIAIGTVDVISLSLGVPVNSCMATLPAAPNDGTYTRTQYSVTVYTESGHRKGTYAIYLHKGKKYIDFNNTWICIQGKSRFGYCGNWYVIK